jgi:hypothetical protein
MSDMAILYSDHVAAQSRRNPCLRNLYHFLDKGNTRNECRIAGLEFHSIDEAPRQLDLDFDSLKCLLRGLNTDVNHVAGRLLIVEDLTKDIIEVLGSSLDIDPLFFASHIYGINVGVRSSKPYIATLPSKARSQNFLSLQYHRIREFGGCPRAPGKVWRDSNVPRKMVISTLLNDAYIGLEEHCCSTLLTSTKGNSWLGEMGSDWAEISRLMLK